MKSNAILVAKGKKPISFLQIKIIIAKMDALAKTEVLKTAIIDNE